MGFDSQYHWFQNWRENGWEGPGGCRASLSLYAHIEHKLAACLGLTQNNHLKSRKRGRYYEKNTNSKNARPLIKRRYSFITYCTLSSTLLFTKSCFFFKFSSWKSIFKGVIKRERERDVWRFFFKNNVPSKKAFLNGTWCLAPPVGRWQPFWLELTHFYQFSMQRNPLESPI